MTLVDMGVTGCSDGFGLNILTGCYGGSLTWRPNVTMAAADEVVDEMNLLLTGGRNAKTVEEHD